MIIAVILTNFFCDYLTVGGGYTGLSAARKLGKIHKNKKIIIVEAQLAGEGASARNSGYLVDTTLNDGFVSNTNLSACNLRWTKITWALSIVTILIPVSDISKTVSVNNSFKASIIHLIADDWIVLISNIIDIFRLKINLFLNIFKFKFFL